MIKVNKELKVKIVVDEIKNPINYNWDNCIYVYVSDGGYMLQFRDVIFNKFLINS